MTHQGSHNPDSDINMDRNQPGQPHIRRPTTTAETAAPGNEYPAPERTVDPDDRPVPEYALILTPDMVKIVNETLIGHNYRESPREIVDDMMVAKWQDGYRTVLFGADYISLARAVNEYLDRFGLTPRMDDKRAPEEHELMRDFLELCANQFDFKKRPDGRFHCEVSRFTRLDHEWSDVIRHYSDLPLGPYSVSPAQKFYEENRPPTAPEWTELTTNTKQRMIAAYIQWTEENRHNGYLRMEKAGLNN